MAFELQMDMRWPSAVLSDQIDDLAKVRRDGQAGARLWRQLPFALAVATLGVTAWAQGTPAPGAGAAVGQATGGGGADASPESAAPGEAGSEGPTRAWALMPRLRLGETITDNVDLRRDGHRDEITQIMPGIRVEGLSARLKGYLDYELEYSLYARDTDRNRTRNALTSFATLEAVEKWLFVDFNGSISQQNINAFQAPSAATTSINSNSTETSSFGLAPYIRGRLLGEADYQLRYERRITRTRSDLASDVDAENLTGSLAGATGLASLGWAVNASRQTTDYSLGRETEADRLYASLIWRIDPQFRVTVSAGREDNNYASLDKESSSTHGYGFDWSPSERTAVSAFRERRFFGDGHSFSLSHRTPLSAWKFTDSRDVSTTSQSGTVGLGTFYDLFFDMLASAVPDPVKRATVVNNLFLANPGLSPTAIVQSNFLASQASVQRRRELSFALTGARNTVTFMATQNRRQAVGNQLLALFDLTFQQSTTVNQRGFSINWSHRLTPISTLSAIALRTDTTGSGGSGLHTTQKSLTVNFSTRLGPKTGASLGLRRVVFDSATSPYTENALTGFLTAQF